MSSNSLNVLLAVILLYWKYLHAVKLLQVSKLNQKLNQNATCGMLSAASMVSEALWLIETNCFVSVK